MDAEHRRCAHTMSRLMRVDRARCQDIWREALRSRIGNGPNVVSRRAKATEKRRRGTFGSALFWGGRLMGWPHGLSRPRRGGQARSTPEGTCYPRRAFGLGVEVAGDPPPATSTPENPPPNLLVRPRNRPAQIRTRSPRAGSVRITLRRFLRDLASRCGRRKGPN